MLSVCLSVCLLEIAAHIIGLVNSLLEDILYNYIILYRKFQVFQVPFLQSQFSQSNDQQKK